MIDSLPFWIQGLIMCLSQVGFVAARTMNVYYNSRLNLYGTMISGAIVHLLWFLGLYLGLGNVFNGNLWIIAWSLSGGLVGVYISIKHKQKETIIYKKRSKWNSKR